ncbi:phytanoyl-CoA dioxygenase family protein [Streptomyces sp. NPDC052040]|uniref:phytanoyl-CoA dioxygenase family protein n=1 Tax=unclassified Streptomyces TaxID=2593676 RepID=UPI0037D74BE6
MTAPIPAPPGFDRDEWETFERDGILILEDVLGASEITALRDIVDTHATKTRQGNIVALDDRFVPLIDHPQHIGRMFDVYGDMLKLLSSEFFRREPGQTIRNNWHFDGPRLLPFSVFGNRVPLRIKVGYWLTALPEKDMGNLVYIPGSHRWDHLPQYHTHEPHPQEKRLTVKAGAMTLMWGGLWHRVDANHSRTTRRNIFLEYGPSWLVASDRVITDPRWAAGLPRERRIILRAYDDQNLCVKPPAEDVPLYLERGEEPAPDPEGARYADHVPLELRRRTTWVERQTQE